MSHTTKTIAVTCVIMGLLAGAGCTSPRPTSSASRSSIETQPLAGHWGWFDAGGDYTFAADGSFQMSQNTIPPHKPLVGTYKVVEPNVMILTYQLGPRTVQTKCYYLKLKNGEQLLTDNFLVFDMLRKRQ